MELVEIGRDECLRLLGDGDFGRVAVNSPGWPPLIRPVHYVFDGSSQSVVFRSAEGSKLTSLLRSQRAAFEVDGTDPTGQFGWSVIVVGSAEEITGAAELERVTRLPLSAWQAGEPSRFMRIRATVVSGRRLVRTPPG